MPGLRSISGLGDGELELLEAVGFLDLRELAEAEAGVLHSELVKANKMLLLLKKVPSKTVVGSWINDAKSSLSARMGDSEDEGEDSEDEVAAEPEDHEGRVANAVNFEADPDVQDMLAMAPLALPLPNRLLADRGISPKEIAIADVLNRAVSDLDVAVSTATKKPKSSEVATPKHKASGVVGVADYRKGSRVELDSARVRSFSQIKDQPRPRTVTPESASPDEERVALIRTPRERTNSGKDPNSRSYVRGVLHDRPLIVWFGSAILVMLQLTLPLAIVAAVLLILTEHPSGHFEWVPNWVLVFPLLVPILGVLYFAVSARVKCRVCTQKLLVPRQCRKNEKAHHVPGLGYLMSLALHVLLFNWFNCTYCGTSIRIKE